MKRPYLLLFLVPLLFGFSLIDYGADQAPRVRWEANYQGAAYNTPVPLGTAFHAPFIPFGYSAQGGFAYWRGDGITCTAGIAGTTDGGSNSVVMEVYHSDGGIDCSVTFTNDCGLTATNAGECSRFQTAINETYYMRMSSSTSCLTTPAQVRCTMDLFR